MYTLCQKDYDKSFWIELKFIAKLLDTSTSRIFRMIRLRHGILALTDRKFWNK